MFATGVVQPNRSLIYTYRSNSGSTVGSYGQTFFLSRSRGDLLGLVTLRSLPLSGFPWR